MAFELGTEAYICYRCGKSYPKRQGNFYSSYAVLYRGIGFLPYCKECVDSIYENYLSQCGNVKDAIRQTCRALNLPWYEKGAELVEAKSAPRSVMGGYMSAVNRSRPGRGYDETLINEGTLWSFINPPDKEEKEETPTEPVEEKPEEDYDVTDEMKRFWGGGYSPSMYKELEERKVFWVEGLKKEGYTEDDIDIGSWSLIRQMCNLEAQINQDRVDGKPIDKNIAALNTLLTSSLKYLLAQKKEKDDTTIDNTPYGKWIQKLENERPVSDPEPDKKDADGIVRFVDTWLYGHLAKMLNIKNARSTLYERAIEDLRVNNPEFDEENDEDLIADIFGEGEDDEY